MKRERQFLCFKRRAINANNILKYRCFVFCRSLYTRAMDLLGATARTSFEFYGSQNTYFIPTDYAFEKLGGVELNRIFSNPSHLRKILSNHQADRILPSTLFKERWQYEIQTKNEIVRIVNRGNKLTV